MTVKNMKTKYISAKEVVNRYKISYSLLNYYTNLGLFSVKKRNGNVRLYDDEEVRSKRLRIAKLIDDGYPLRLICRMLNT